MQSISRGVLRNVRACACPAGPRAYASLASRSPSGRRGVDLHRYTVLGSAALGLALGLAIALPARVHADDAASIPRIPADQTSAHPDKPAAVPHPADNSGLRVVKVDEVQKHTRREEGVWVVVEGVVWDVTEFLDGHPGGAQVILSNAGKDATKLFKSLHPKNTLQDNADLLVKVGVVDPSELQAIQAPESDEDKKRQEARDNMMGSSGMVNLDDFETLARTILSPAALAYYESGSDDESTLHHNRSAYSRIRFRPRVLRKVATIDTTTTILGVPTSLPVWIAPAAMAKLGHPLGEVNLTRGAGETDMLQVISSNSSCSLDELVAEKAPDQQLAWQLYVAADRARAERTIKHAVELGVQSIWLTVDAPVGGKRERDLKEKIARDPPARDFKPDPNTKSESAVQFSYVDADLCWDDIAWIRKLAPGKAIVLKGIQCVEDAVMAAEHGVQGIVLSNHGGRQLDGSRPPIEVLQEIRKLRPELLTQMEVFVDGGIRRGTDVLKALALGAKAVGMGRPFLYAQSAYGAEGVVRAHEIIKEELVTGMRLMGVTKLSELKPEMVDCLPP